MCMVFLSEENEEPVAKLFVVQNYFYRYCVVLEQDHGARDYRPRYMTGVAKL